MKYRKKPIIVDATQWFKNGDHPDDEILMVRHSDGAFPCEGKVVRYYRTPLIDGQEQCRHCAQIMHVHGWIDTLGLGHIVCPGDWVITGIDGERYPCKPDIFADTYELAEAS